MLLALTCAVCGAAGASPCATCHAALRPAPVGAAPPGLDGLVALVRYEGAGRVLVARLKYGNQRAALGWLAEGLASRVDAPVDVVTWAPTIAEHRRRRGYDQGELLAREVARRLGVPARALLRRVDATGQTGRSARDRREHGPVFGPLRRLARPTRVLVVDDVVTTGATLRAARAALHAAGATSVRPAALALTPAR